jgi:hypothetical protein
MTLGVYVVDPHGYKGVFQVVSRNNKSELESVPQSTFKRGGENIKAQLKPNAYVKDDKGYHYVDDRGNLQKIEPIKVDFEKETIGIMAGIPQIFPKNNTMFKPALCLSAGDFEKLSAEAAKNDEFAEVAR